MIEKIRGALHRVRLPAPDNKPTEVVDAELDAARQSHDEALRTARAVITRSEAMRAQQAVRGTARRN